MTHVVRKMRWWFTGLASCGMLVQSGSCMFDTEAFINTSLYQVSLNSSTFFISTVLSEWLKVTPGFSL